MNLEGRNGSERIMESPLQLDTVTIFPTGDITSPSSQNSLLNHPQNSWKILLLIGGLVIAVSLLLWGMRDGSNTLTILLLWVSSIGLWGNVLYIVFYWITSFPVPMGTTPLALSAGFLYGVPLGFVTVTIGSVSGAVLSFWISKKYFSNWVLSKVRVSTALTAIIKAVEKHSFKMCFFVRLSPIPFGLQNSLFALSNITFSTYFYASFLGLFPEQFMFVYFGSTAKEFKDIFDGKAEQSPLKTGLLFLQILIIIGIIIFLLYTGRKAFNQAVKEDEESDSSVES